MSLLLNNNGKSIIPQKLGEGEFTNYLFSSLSFMILVWDQVCGLFSTETHWARKCKTRNIQSSIPARTSF